MGLGPGTFVIFSTINGSYNTPANSLKTDSLTFTLQYGVQTLGDHSGLFYLANTNSPNPGDIQLGKNAGGEAGDAYMVRITATDAAGNGLSTDLDFVVILE